MSARLRIIILSAPPPFTAADSVASEERWTPPTAEQVESAVLAVLTADAGEDAPRLLAGEIVWEVLRIFNAPPGRALGVVAAVERLALQGTIRTDGHVFWLPIRPEEVRGPDADERSGAPTDAAAELRARVARLEVALHMTEVERQDRARECARLRAEVRAYERLHVAAACAVKVLEQDVQRVAQSPGDVLPLARTERELDALPMTVRPALDVLVSTTRETSAALARMEDKAGAKGAQNPEPVPGSRWRHIWQRPDAASLTVERVVAGHVFFKGLDHAPIDEMRDPKVWRWTYLPVAKRGGA